MDTLLFTDQPNIEIYVDLARRDVVSVLDEMMDDVDSPEDWYNEKEEAKTFDECLKESLVHLMFEVPELIHIMRYLHEETHCSVRFYPQFYRVCVYAFFVQHVTCTTARKYRYYCCKQNNYRDHHFCPCRLPRCPFLYIFDAFHNVIVLL